MTRTIIATTDFSDIADNAVRYACHLAVDVHVQVTLLHSFVIPVTFSDTPMPILPLDESRQIAEERMNSYLNQLRIDFPSLEIHSRIMYGDVVDCIHELSDDMAPLLVVMGNSGDDMPLWMGSNLMKALKKLKRSVMGVPLGVSYAPVKSICLTSDLKIQEYGPLTALKELTGAALHLLHINNGKATGPNGKSDLLEKLAGLQPQYHEEENTDIDAGIQDFLNAHQIEWLILVPHKYSLLESLFHKSQTRAVARTSQIPVIALHE
jgi:nucleotide-binding universal stress UspA family protein